MLHRQHREGRYYTAGRGLGEHVQRVYLLEKGIEGGDARLREHEELDTGRCLVALQPEGVGLERLDSSRWSHLHRV